MLVIGHLLPQEIAVEVVQALIQEDVGDGLGFRVDDFLDGVEWCSVLRMIHIIVINAILTPNLGIFLVLVLVDPLEECREHLLAVVFVVEFLAVLHAFEVYPLDLA